MTSRRIADALEQPLGVAPHFTTNHAFADDIGRLSALEPEAGVVLVDMAGNATLRRTLPPTQSMR
jgi:hypothetical protein